jgi:phosphate-selective porin OprO and OprP
MKQLTIALLLLTAFSASLRAGEVVATSGKNMEAVVQPAKEKSIYDKIWGLAVLYKNEDAPFLQELSLVGRQQNEWYYFENDDEDDSDFVNRRTRIGLKAKLFHTLTAHVETDLDLEDHDPIYNKLTDAYLRWSPSKEFNLTVGKHGTKFTLDGSTSSTQLITIDRSNIANNFWFPEEYIPGVSASGEVGNWIYNVGYFTSGEASPEFGDFNAGSFGLFSVGYNFAKALDVDKAILRFDYVYQDEHPNNTKGTPAPFTRNHEQVASLNFLYENGPWGLGTDVVASDGYRGQPDLFGVQIMPSYTLGDGWQAVFRYTYINSDGDNGIRFARYENRLESGRGDEYNEFYVGINKYFYGHKLKWQTGVQYTTMDDHADDGGEYDGWGVTTGIRISW